MDAQDPHRWRFFGYVLGGLAIGGAFAAAAFSLPPASATLRSTQEHALLDLAIALSACFCGLQALVRYQSRPQRVFLWLGAGFLASGMLDGLHAMLSLEAAASPDVLDEGKIAWLLSSLLLAAYLATGFGGERSGSTGRVWLDVALVGGATVLVLAVAMAALLLVPVRIPMPELGPLAQPYELAAAAAMGAALYLLWRHYSLLDLPLQRRVVPALAIYFVSHAGIMAWTAASVDAFVMSSHFARFLGHWLVLVGLLQSSANRLSEAEKAREQIAAQTEELESSERHIRSIVHHAPYAILGADHEGLVRSINPVAAQIFGVPQAQALGRPLSSFFDAALQSDLAEALRPNEQTTRARILRDAGSPDETSRSRWAMSRQARGIKGNGEVFPIALTLTDTMIGGQRFFTAFVRDLTQALEQEGRVHSALMLATRILDQSSVAILSTDAGGRITRINRTAQQWLGVTEAEAVGKLTPATFLDPRELTERARVLEGEHSIRQTTDVEVVLALARLGAADTNAWTLVTRGGARIPVSISVGPLTTEAGAVTGFVLVASDLSEQKEVEKLKNEFVSTVSHELRTPLTSIRGSLGLLAGGLAGKLPAQAQGLLEIAQRNTERLILLINDILDIEKIEAGKMRFAIKPLDLDALVAEAVQQAEGLASTRSVTLVRRGVRAAVRVHGDEHRLMQVMANLLSNAVKFSAERGAVEVALEEADGKARFSVTDHGSGIPEASQGRIFQKFFQADASSSREKGGTGLGLSICKALIEHMDGQIGFRSRPGETVFWFELPLETRAAGGRGQRALVVEDDADAAAVLCQILRQTGVDTEIAPSAARAREMLDAGAYDCMLLDCLLPDQDGLELLSFVRQQPHGKDLPVVIVSIYEPDRAKAATLGVTEWLTKPIDSKRLLAAVRRVLNLPATATGTA